VLILALDVWGKQLRKYLGASEWGQKEGSLVLKL